MNIFSVIFIIMAFSIGISLLCYFISNFKKINVFMGYGVLMAVVVTVIEYIGNGFNVSIVDTLISLIKIAIYTSTGVYLCSILGYKDIPLIKKFINNNDDSRIDIKSYIFSTLIVITGSVIFTIILFKFTSPTASDYIKSNLKSESFNGNILSICMFILTMLGTVITEELTFRLVVQNFLAKIFNLDGKKYWIAITISSLYWALAHANTTNPEWVKFVQIFPMGLALGWLYKKFGLESSIIAHLCFNFILIFVFSRVITI